MRAKLRGRSQCGHVGHRHSSQRPTETRAQRGPNSTSCVVGWRPWEEEVENVWDWTQTDGGPRDMAEPGCKTPTSSGRPVPAGIRRRFVQPRRRFEKQRQARQGSSTALQSDLAQNAPDVDTWTDRKSWSAARRKEHLQASPNPSISIGSASSGVRTSDFHSTIFKFPNTVNGQTRRQAEDENRKWWVGSWHTRIAETPTFKCDEELLTKCINKLKKTQQFSRWRHSRNILQNWAHLSSHSPSKTCSHPSPFPSNLSEFRPVSSLSTMMRNLLGYIWMAAKNSRFAQSFCSGESHRAREGVEDDMKCGTTGPQEGLRSALLGDNSAARQRGRATSKSAWRVSPTVNASPSREVSHKEHQSH